MRRVNFQKPALYNLVRIFLFVYAGCRLVAAYHIDHNRNNFVKPLLVVVFNDNVIIDIFLDNFFVLLPLFYPSYRINVFWCRQGSRYITVSSIDRIGYDFSIARFSIILFSIVKISIIIFIIIWFRFSKVCTFDFRKSGISIFKSLDFRFPKVWSFGFRKSWFSRYLHQYKTFSDIRLPVFLALAFCVQ